jgi:hypothetical protein
MDRSQRYELTVYGANTQSLRASTCARSSILFVVFALLSSMASFLLRRSNSARVQLSRRCKTPGDGSGMFSCKYEGELT